MLTIPASTLSNLVNSVAKYPAMTEPNTTNTITPVSGIPAVDAVSDVAASEKKLESKPSKVTPVSPVVSSPVLSSRRETTENRVAEISSLLNALEAAASESGLASGRIEEPVTENSRRDQLLSEGRLGMVDGLLKALRYKHPHSAAHCLRVALRCSAWAEHLGVGEDDRDTLELAALMHDIGKIGATESLLHNPNRLTSEEQASAEQFRAMGLDILSSCCGDSRVLEAVKYVGVHFDHQAGSDLPLNGRELPLAARMITIVDAYDAMTTDQVYRPAKSQERALGELFEIAGSQFDPALVKQFAGLLTQNQ